MKKTLYVIMICSLLTLSGCMWFKRVYVATLDSLYPPEETTIVEDPFDMDAALLEELEFIAPGTGEPITREEEVNDESITTREIFGDN